LQYDAVAFLSKFLEDVWLNREGAVVRRSAVTYLGVDTDKFGLRVTSGYCNPPRFLYAGRLDPEKDPLTCLDAAEIAALRRLPVKLTIAAADSLDTGYAQHVARRAQEVVSSVRLVRGTPPDRMPALLHDNDVLILPSRSEGLSNLLLEAMACGLAVLATRCGGPDEILVDGENCLIFPFGHAEALAERMARLTREPDVVARLGQNAQRLVRQRFTMSDYLDKVEALLQQTIADYPQLRSAPKGVREG